MLCWWFIHLEKRADVHVEPEVCESSGDDLCSSIVTVLTHFGHEQTGVPPFMCFKLHDPAGQTKSHRTSHLNIFRRLN